MQEQERLSGGLDDIDCCGHSSQPALTRARCRTVGGTGHTEYDDYDSQWKGSDEMSRRETWGKPLLAGAG